MEVVNVNWDQTVCGTFEEEVRKAKVRHRLIGKVPARQAQQIHEAFARLALRRQAKLLRERGGYAGYLRSSLWRMIRQRVLKRDEGRCRCCQKPACEVHHLNYGDDTMRGRSDASLISVCRYCHDVIEFDTGRRRRTPAEKALMWQGILGCAVMNCD